MKKENWFTRLFLSLLVMIEFSIHYNYVLNALSMTDIQGKKNILMIHLYLFYILKNF